MIPAFPDCRWVDANAETLTCEVCYRPKRKREGVNHRRCIIGWNERDTSMLPPVSRGPGSMLHAILAELNFGVSADCGCDERIAEMNRNGVEWCKTNRETIIGWLKESAAKRGWLEKLEAANELRKRDWWSAFDPIGSIVDRAIYLAEAASQAAHPDLA